MKLKKKLLIFSSTLLTSLLTFSLSACGGSTGGTTSTGGVNESVGSIADDDPIFGQGGLENDLVLDEEGKPLFEEEVTLKMWSIIGDPDQATFRQLINKFNNEFVGQIYLDVSYYGHFDYYSTLDTTYATEFEESFPDVCVMHTEKTAQYANKEYLYSLNGLFEKCGVDLDFSLAYENIDRSTMYRGHRFGVPVDGQGFVTSFRQDIIKKNGLGFDNNTRFIPNSRAEYETLLKGLREKADAGELYTRNINKGQDHSWKKASASEFYPSFTQSTDPDGISALYVNGGRMVSEDQTTVKFHENDGFKAYITDQVERTNAKLIGESGTAAEMFGAGRTVMFSEGPWWVSQTYTPQWNNTELRKAENGVSAEDIADPDLAYPYVASHPTGWWTLDENKDGENADKWYGNGHAISLTKHVTSMQKAAAALTFMQWYTQAQDEESGDYNLTKWCSSGHIPAWKNVYESDGYKTLLEKNVTLKALGDPADLMTMEGLIYEDTVFAGLSSAITTVQSALKSSDGCTKERALQLLEEAAMSTQTSLDLMNMGF